MASKIPRDTLARVETSQLSLYTALAAGAEVFVGNFSAAEKRQNPFQCGGQYPRTASTSVTEFRCSTTLWIRYIQIKKFADKRKPWLLPMQICEVEGNHTS